MIQLSETLALQTVEGFLTGDEMAQLMKIMDAELAVTGWQPGHQGDVVAAPSAAQEILHAATERALPALHWVLPSVTTDGPWDYTEFTPGQQVPVHVDGIPRPGTAPRWIGRIGVMLTEAEEGGEFYVATTSHPSLFTGHKAGQDEGFAPDTPLTRALPEVHQHTAEGDWLRDVPRTRWTCDAPAGTGLAYGSQLLHGVAPVRKGRMRKFVADLTDTP